MLLSKVSFLSFFPLSRGYFWIFQRIIYTGLIMCFFFQICVCMYFVPVVCMYTLLYMNMYVHTWGGE